MLSVKVLNRAYIVISDLYSEIATGITLGMSKCNMFCACAVVLVGLSRFSASS